MPFPVKLLVAGDPPPGSGALHKGDIIEVVPWSSDWGAKTVSPSWIRLTVTDVPGTDQVDAEDRARLWLSNWRDAFTVSSIPGGIRVEAGATLIASLPAARRIQIRNKLVELTGGTVSNQGQGFIEITTTSAYPLIELADEISRMEFRRWRFPASVIDTAVAGSTPGQPIEVSRTMQQATAIVEDKLKN